MSFGRKTRIKIRKKLYKENPHCFWCGEIMILEPACQHCTEDMATLEHLKPQSEGGSHHPFNLRLVHKRCNR